MKRKIAKLALAALMVSTMGTAAYAADPVTSTAKVHFDASTDTPLILDPATGEPMENQPTTDENGTVSGQAGPLSLDYASNLDFGAQKLEARDMIYQLSAASKEPMVQITDKRGTGGGWKVSAQLSSFEGSSEGVATLVDSSITLSNGSLVTSAKNKEAAAPTVNPTVTLASNGAAANVYGAAKDKGQGTWIALWNNSDVTLSVKSNPTLKAGTHTATITWTLSDTPM